MALIKISRQLLASLELDVLANLHHLITRQGNPHAEAIRGALAKVKEANASDIVFLFRFNHQLIGFCLGALHEDKAHLQHLLVDKQHQAKGLGEQLMYGMFRQLTQSGTQSIRLNAIARQRDWMENRGFIHLESTTPGSVNRDFEFLHPSLRFYQQTRPQGEHANDHMRLGKDAQRHAFDHEAAALALHKHLILQARRRIWLCLDTTRNSALNCEETAIAMIQVVKRNPQADIRVLVEDDRQGLGHFNPAIEALQKLSSYCDIRTLNRTGQRLREQMALIDTAGSFIRQDFDSWRGEVCYNSRLQTSRLCERFEQVWQYARPSQELKRLAL